MLNIHELERRWIKYKIQKYTPIIVSLFSISVLSILYIIWPSKDQIPSLIDKNNSSIPILIENNNTIAVIKDTTRIEKKVILTPPIVEKVLMPKEKLVLKPSFNFMYEIEEDLINEPTIENENNSLPLIKEKDTSSNIIPDIEEIPSESIVPREKDPSPVLIKDETFNIKRESGTRELQNIINRFKKSKKPALSLFIARKYYSMKEYEKSYNYALMTNQLNRDIEESWLIFSKSLVKLNQVEMAKSTLKNYIKQSNSIKATSLLNEINTGNFK